MSAIKTKTFVVQLKNGQSKYNIFAENQGNMYHIVDITVIDYPFDPSGTGGAGGSSSGTGGVTLVAPNKCFHTGETMTSTDILNSSYIVLREGSDQVHEFIPVAEILKRMDAKGERFPVGRNIDLNKSELFVGNKSSMNDGEVVVLSVSYLDKV